MRNPRENFTEAARFFLNLSAEQRAQALRLARMLVGLARVRSDEEAELHQQVYWALPQEERDAIDALVLDLRNIQLNE